jgi:hypothetical protein
LLAISSQILTISASCIESIDLSKPRSEEQLCKFSSSIPASDPNRKGLLKFIFPTAELASFKNGVQIIYRFLSVSSSSLFSGMMVATHLNSIPPKSIIPCFVASVSFLPAHSPSILLSRHSPLSHDRNPHKTKMEMTLYVLCCRGQQ